MSAVDFHESSSEATRWVMRHLAPDAEHALIHVLDLPELPGPLRGLGRDREQLRASAREAAAGRLTELAGTGDAARTTTHIREGKPPAEILRLAAEVGADLIVVGEQGPRRGAGALLGSTAERVLHGSPVPVLVGRNMRDAPPARLLAAVDPDPVAERVLLWTGLLIERFEARATVLNVVDSRLLADEFSGFPRAAELRRLTEDATMAMQGWLAKMLGRLRMPPRIATSVVIGDPAYEIISAADRAGAALLLLGSKGGDIARTPLSGRIINKVVRSAPCSVLVITPNGASIPAPES